MFSGIIEESAVVTSIKSVSGGASLCLRSALDHSGTSLGDSICIEGVCLTVVKKQKDNTEWELAFDLAEETVERSVLGKLKTGQRVNIERSLQVGSRIHGHFVLGHVDSSVRLLERKVVGNSERFLWELPADYRQFVAEKGSVTLAGISLTVGEVSKTDFAVYIIPHTAEVTTLGDRKVGDRVNFEVDVLARYLVNAETVHRDGVDKGVTRELLSSRGFDGDAQ